MYKTLLDLLLDSHQTFMYNRSLHVVLPFDSWAQSVHMCLKFCQTSSFLWKNESTIFHICCWFHRRSLFSSFSFYTRKELLLSARLSHQNSVRSSVCPSVTQVDQAKTVQARITKSSPLAAWKTIVSGTIKLFHKFEGGDPKQGC